MDVRKMIADLVREKGEIDQAIAALTPLATGQRRRGRPPAYIAQAQTKRRGRPLGSKNRGKEATTA